MNRFLSKKKGEKGEKGGESSPSPPPHAGSKWRKTSKKDVPEPMSQPATLQRSQIDLSSALPSTDDFRTSLIMPTLSGRFSMLREQDDPNSKLGKASDDSVLAPRRSSRMMEFAFTPSPLNDIAEVASITSSFQVPSARDRQDAPLTPGSGDGPDDDGQGSIMSRARPTQHNTLFGGRQKVYKIGASTASDSNSTSESGRMLYDDDINMSSFQKYRALQQREAALAAEQDQHAASSGDDETISRTSEDVYPGVGLGLTQSQSHVQRKNRGSDSTTTSIPSQGRTSTAATSVASQSIGTAVTSSSTFAATSTIPAVPPLERSLTKKRLYEQGLEKNTYEQQSSTMTRLNSLHGLRSPTLGGPMSPPVPALSHSRSIGQMHERSFQPYMHSNGFSNSSIGLRKASSSSAMSPITTSRPQSPLSPTMSESEEYQTLLSALEPGDRGKATAMGAFNKPAQQYDEEQYAQRQVQLQQSIQPHTARSNSIDLNKRSGSSLSRFDSGRQTDKAGARSRSGSLAHATSPKARHSPDMSFPVFQNGSKQNRGVQGENAFPKPPSGPLPPQPTTADTHRTFFGDISASDDEDEEDQMSSYHNSAGRFNHTPLTSVSEHPAHRHETSDLIEVDEEGEEEEEQEEEDKEAAAEHVGSVRSTQSPVMTFTLQRTLTSESEDKSEIHGDDALVDSPTIGNENGLGGLIQHLRNISDQSSIFPPSQGRESIGYSAVPAAWDLDEIESFYAEPPVEQSSSRNAFFPEKGQPLAPSPSKGNVSSRPSTRESDIIDPAPWQTQLKKHTHTREASSATQAERHAFDAELAARQKAIQEKMRSIVESDSRGTSPGPTSSGAMKAFGMLKMKPSQESIPREHGNGAKAMKMLGIDNHQHVGFEDAQQQAKSSNMAKTGSRGPTANSEWPLGQSKEKKVIRNFSKGIQPQKAAAPTQETSRERSNSSASKSKTGNAKDGYKDDYGSPPAVPTSTPAVRPSMETTRSLSQPSIAESRSGRRRADSKSEVYLDQNSLHASRNVTPLGQVTPAKTSPSSSVSPGNYSKASSEMPRPSYSTQSSLTTQGSKGASPSTMGRTHVPAMRSAGSVLRKKAISKADIGEPTLISSTSNVETVDLPTARLIVQPPLISDLSPRRHVLAGQGRSASSGEAATVAEQRNKAMSTPPMQHANSFAGYGEVVSEKAGGARFDPLGSPVLNGSGMF